MKRKRTSPQQVSKEKIGPEHEGLNLNNPAITKEFIREQLKKSKNSEGAAMLEFWSERNARTLLDVSRTTLYLWLKEGKIEGRRVGRKVYVERKSAINFIASSPLLGNDLNRDVL